MRRLGLVLGALWLAGCDCGGGGDGDGGADAAVPVDAGGSEDAGADAGELNVTFDVQSGTRLKTRWHESADGARRFLGWFDSGRGENCSFAVAGDGVLRCLSSDSATVSTSWYLDAACTVRVATVSRLLSCAPPVVLRSDDVTTCPARTRRFQRGAEVTSADGGTGQLYSLSSTSTCSPSTPTFLRAFRVGAEILPSSFISATASTRPLSPSLGVTTLATEDGARAFGGLVEAPSGRVCSVKVAKDLVHRCLPDTSAYFSLSSYQDAACTQQTVLQESTALGCAAPSVGQRTDTATCPLSTTILTTGAALATVYNRGGSGTCAALPPSTVTRYLAAGSEQPPSGFLATPQVDGPVFGRLLERDFSLAPGGRQFSHLVDTQLDAGCAFEPASDGSLRCLPTDFVSAIGYADATCRTRLGVTYSARCGEPAFARAAEEGTCPARLAHYRVSGIYTGTVYYLDGATCYADTAVVKAWTLGPELPPTTFVEGSAVLE